MKKTTKKHKPHFEVVSVGSAVRDIVFHTNQAELLNNPKKDPTKLKLIGFEYGAKIRSDDVVEMLGGGAANTSIGMARLGIHNAALISVGVDAAGQEILEAMSSAGVDMSFAQQDHKQFTGLSFLVVEDKTHEHVAFVNYGANMVKSINVSTLNKFTTDWFYISSLSIKTWPAAMRAMLNTSAHVAWNPGATQLRATARVLKPLIRKTHLLILNKDEATELAFCLGMKRKRGSTNYPSRDLAEYLFEQGPQMVMITNGRHGSHVYDGHKLHFAKPTPDKPVDTTGAGDCFGSSFTTGLIKYSGDIDKALRLAIVNSTNLVAHTGAQQGLLTWAQAKKRI